jgi:hypothetical protein
MMDLSQRKEQFSRAYIHAIATVAGFTLYEPKVDDESVDLGIAGRIASDIPRPPRLEIQLKCTSDKIVKDKDIVFSLKRKNYDDLRLDDLIVPRLLVVLVVPRKDDDWLKHSETETTIRHCAYWASLRGMEDKRAKTKVSISFPRTNLFCVEALRELMRRVSHREPL